MLQDIEGDKPEAETAEKKEVGPMAMVLQILMSLAFMIGLYKLLPLLIATQIGHHVEALHGRFAINMVDGVVRIGIFLALYVCAFAAAGYAPDVSVSRRGAQSCFQFRIGQDRLG